MATPSATTCYHAFGIPYSGNFAVRTWSAVTSVVAPLVMAAASLCSIPLYGWRVRVDRGMDALRRAIRELERSLADGIYRVLRLFGPPPMRLRLLLHAAYAKIALRLPEPAYRSARYHSTGVHFGLA